MGVEGRARCRLPLAFGRIKQIGDSIEITAAEFFGLPVRIGVPATLAGLTDTVKQPEYATAVGLVLFGPRGDGSPPRRAGSVYGALSRVTSWFGSIWS